MKDGMKIKDTVEAVVKTTSKSKPRFVRIDPSPHKRTVCFGDEEPQVVPPFQETIITMTPENVEMTIL